MTDFELTRTVLALAGFRPPEGVDIAIVIRPQPGYSRVAVGFSAIEGDATYIALTEPPDETTLRTLYRTAQAILDAAWDSPIQAGPAWAAGMGLDMAKLGGDS